MPTAFVAGATGYTGQQVVSCCVAAGIRTIAHVRPDSSRLAQWASSFVRDGSDMNSSAWEFEALLDALNELKPDVVFALLGTTKARGRKGSDSVVSDTYEAVDYGLTKMLLDASRACETVPRFVYLSSVGVSDKEPSGAYMNVRWRIEQDLINGGTPYTIVRPSFITGPDRDELRVGERVGAAVADGLLGALGAVGAKKLRDKYSSMTSGELGSALTKVAFDEAQVNAILEADSLR